MSTPMKDKQALLWSSFPKITGFMQHILSMSNALILTGVFLCRPTGYVFKSILDYFSHIHLVGNLCYAFFFMIAAQLMQRFQSRAPSILPILCIALVPAFYFLFYFILIMPILVAISSGFVFTIFDIWMLLFLYAGLFFLGVCLSFISAIWTFKYVSLRMEEDHLRNMRTDFEKKDPTHALTEIPLSGPFKQAAPSPIKPQESSDLNDNTNP